MQHFEYCIDYSQSDKDKTILEKKLGEILGLGNAAQKAMEEILSTSGDKRKVINKIKEINKNKALKILVNSFNYKLKDVDERTIEEISKITEINAYHTILKYFKIGLGSFESLELLCLTEEGNFVNYEGIERY